MAVFLIYIVLAAALGRFFPLGTSSWPHLERLGDGLSVLGALFILTAFGRFSRAGTSVEVGRSAAALVTDGPYALSRNPIYLGLMLVAVGRMIGNLWVFLLLVPTLFALQRMVIEKEEAHLESRFGEEYRRYKASVRRWL